MAKPPGSPPGGRSGDAPQSPTSPTGRRISRPQWRDTRLLAGVLLILASVVIGARFVNAATRTGQWLSLTRALPAGHVLAVSDLEQVSAHLPGSAGQRYFTARPAQLAGRTLARSLAAGELLPADSLASGSAPASRLIPLVVKAGRLPTLAAGDRVDVYVFSKVASKAGAGGREVRVLTDVEFVDQDPLSTGETSVELRVAPQDAIVAIAASQSDRLDVVKVERDSADLPGEPGPSSLPAFDGP